MAPFSYHQSLKYVLLFQMAGLLKIFSFNKNYFMSNHNGGNNSDDKGQQAENRTGQENQQQTGHHKLPDNPNNPPESISTAGDTANGKNSRTNIRDEDVDNSDVRGENE